MADKTTDPKEEPAKTTTTVPVEEWIQHPVSDSAEYLDREAPAYGDKLDGKQAEEFEAAVSEREKRRAGHKTRDEQTPPS